MVRTKVHRNLKEELQLKNVSKSVLTVGERLRKLRGKRTKSAVATALGISRSSYVKYERNERNPSDQIKQKIANFYGSTVGAIFFD